MLGGGSWWIVVNQLMWSHMITSGLEVGKMIQGEEVGREDVLGGSLHCGTAFGGGRRVFRWRRGGGDSD